MSSVQVSVVAADRLVWSGEASMVLARTVEGELAVMPGHTPLMGILDSGEVRVTPVEGDQLSADIDHGFLSVDHDRVLVVAESVTINGK